MIRQAAIIASLVADGLAIYTIAEFMAAGYETNAHAVSAWAFVVVAVAGWALPRFYGGFQMPERRAFWLTGLSAVLLIYAILRIEISGDVAVWDTTWISNFLSDAEGSAQAGGKALVGAVLLLAAWVRVSMRSADEIEMETIPKSVGFGFALVTLFVIFGAATDRSGEVARAGTAFYAVAVLALAGSQLALSGATIGDVRAGGVTATLLGATAGLTLLGLLLVVIFVGLLGPTLGPIISATVEGVLTIILTPIAWVLEKFFSLLFGGANPFPDIQENLQDRTQEAGDPRGEDRSGFERASTFLLRSLALLIMLAIVAAAITVFTRIRRRSQTSELEQRVSSSTGNLGDDFRGLLRSLFSRGPRRAPVAHDSETARLYFEVLARAEKSGHPRKEAETAGEFAPTLSETFHTDVTDRITRAFEQARYAGREPDPRELEELQRRWRMLN